MGFTDKIWSKNHLDLWSISPTFYVQRKKDSQLKQLLALSGSARIKAASKHVDEIDPRSRKSIIVFFFLPQQINRCENLLWEYPSFLLSLKRYFFWSQSYKIRFAFKKVLNFLKIHCFN